MKDGVEYPVDIDEDGITRDGKYGALKILPLYGGTEFEEEILDGCWDKGWTTGIAANQNFTAIVNTTTNRLEIQGEAASAGTAGYGWINNQNPIVLLDGVEITVAMQVPVDDTGGTASRNIGLYFILKQDRNQNSPVSDSDYIMWYISVSDTGLLNYVQQRIGAATGYNLFYGSTYVAGSSRATGDLETAIFRFVFYGKPGESGSYVKVYLKQSDTFVNAEAATENELSSSPFSTEEWNVHTVYPCFEILTQNETMFDSGSEAIVDYVRVTYPEYEVKYDAPDDNLPYNVCELWDGNPDDGGVRVYDVDHVFANDIYIRNGLSEWFNTDGEIIGFEQNYWDGSAGGWRGSIRYFRFRIYAAGYAQNFWFEKILYLSSEKIIVRFKATDDETNDDDIFIKFDFTVSKGKTVAMLNNFEIYPLNGFYFWLYRYGNHIGYAGDGVIGDYDLGVNGTNSTLTDNFVTMVEEANTYKSLSIMCFNRTPPDYQTEGRSSYTDYFTLEQTADLKIWMGFSYYPNNNMLFLEAEDASTDGDVVTDVDASPDGIADNAVELDAQTEYVYEDYVAGTDIEAGRYLIAWRVKDTNQVASDVRLRVLNITDGSVFRNQENASAYTVVTASYDYYCQVFDITQADVTGGDTIRFILTKNTATANTITVDYFTIIPLGNGESYPQDVSHNAMRSVNLDRRIKEV